MERDILKKAAAFFASKCKISVYSVDKGGLFSAFIVSRESVRVLIIPIKVALKKLFA